MTEDFCHKNKEEISSFRRLQSSRILRFDGFKEETNETWRKSDSIIKDFVKEKIEIEENISIERAHETGEIEKK